jgi:hypothetical protein
LWSGGSRKIENRNVRKWFPLIIYKLPILIIREHY